MSKYTTELRFICESYAGHDESVDGDSIENVITNALPKLFNFNFPIFDENYRTVLERKIVMHYYTREIGYETVGRWKLALNTKLNEIMPYYNKLYESELLQFNPIYSHDIYTKRDNTATNNTQQSTSQTHSNSAEGTNYRLHSDTPQGGLTGVDNETYLSDVQKITTNNSDTGSSSGTNNVANTNIDDYLEHIYGFEGYSPNKLLKEFRENMLNIDMMIIKDLNKLFLGLW